MLFPLFPNPAYNYLTQCHCIFFSISAVWAIERSTDFLSTALTAEMCGHLVEFQLLSNPVKDSHGTSLAPWWLVFFPLTPDLFHAGGGFHGLSLQI